MKKFLLYAVVTIFLITINTSAQRREWPGRLTNRRWMIDEIGLSLTAEQVDDYTNLLINDPDSIHTLITITYDDADDAMDFIVDSDLHNFSWINVVDGDITNTLTSSVCTGNAATATALATNGGNAGAGNAVLGVDASGAAEGAFDVWTEAENTAASYISASPFGVSIDDTELTAEDFGDFTSTGGENGCTLDANTVAGAELLSGDYGDVTIDGAGAITVDDLFLKLGGDTTTGDYTFGTDLFFIDDTNDQVVVGGTTGSQELSLIGDLELEDTNSNDTGVIYKGTDRFIHNFHHPTGNTAIPLGRNTFFGVDAGNFTMGSTAAGTYQSSNNAAFGFNAFKNNTLGYNCLAFGSHSLYSNTEGSDLTAVGTSSLYSNTRGHHNTALGSYSMYSNTLGFYNLAMGFNSLRSNIDGDYGTALGNSAGYSNQSGSSFVYLGNYAGYHQTGSNILIIDNQNRGSDVNEAAMSLIYGVFDADPANQDLTFNANVGFGTTTPTAALQMGDDKLIAVDVNAGLTASTTQNQGQGALTAQVNEISTVANDNDTVTLPTAVTGIEIEIINNGANTLRIFPASGDDLGLGVNTFEELKANERVKFVAYDTTNWAKESTTEIIHAEIHDEDNVDAFVINDAGGDFHSYHTNGLVAGDLADWAFDAGGAGTSFPIASIADGADSGVDIAVTTTGFHGLAAGDIVSQTNLANAAYVGIFDVKAIISTTVYEVAAVFTATGTGTMDQAATLEADAVAAGVYSFAYYISGTLVGNNETFDFQLHREATVVTGSKIRRKFGAANDFGSMSGGGVVSVANGDKISFALSNENSAANIILRNLTIVLIRL